MANKDEEDTKRFCVSVDLDLYQKIRNTIPWGQTAEILLSLLRMLIAACEEKDNSILYKILNGKAKIVILDD
jgi:hypothetical protein